ARINQVANGLHGFGVGSGHKVAALIDNRFETAEAVLGVMRSGAAIAPINITISDDAIRTQLLDCEPSLIIASPAEALRIDGLGGLSALQHCPRVVVGGEAPGWIEFTQWREAQPSTAPSARPAPEDLCTIIYSSGTTGIPKGISHSHRGRVGYAVYGAQALRMHEDGVTVCTLGFYSNATWVSLLSALAIGSTAVIEAAFKPEMFLNSVQQHRATHVFLVPLQYRMLLECPSRDSFDVSSLQALCAAGAVMSGELKERLSQWVHCAFVEAYGLTEGFVTILSDRDGRRKPSSVGRPLPGSDMKIVREDGSEAACGECGEIVGLSAFVMDGYYKRPVETAEAFLVDERGRRWLRTGDVGYVDEEGFLYLRDRKKDMIVSGGQNVFPIDIEMVAAQHPDVAQVAVIGVEHEKWGETPLAVIVPRAGKRPQAQELAAWINERVGKRQRVSGVVFRQSLPLNALGKVLKRQLRAELAGTASRRAESSETFGVEQ
ncbi:MAG TPA: class I adenylate-forming enzyme family protein, partial [Steroidobacter sp.]|uniref:class I adenylate-forming enzyme family protein n=1 Tax=Steroidobacter sp. TaxID=1978227 RepID=UPI002ED91C4C